MKVLIIIDPQTDFMDSGVLPVKGASKAMENLSEYYNKEKFDYVIQSMDTHPENHCSFVEQGGIFPPHCILASGGWLTTKELTNILPDEYIFKGRDSDVEEFSAFEKSYPGELDEVSEIVVAGVAGDICVLHSVKDLLKHGVPKEKIKLYLPGIACIDEEIFLNFVEENNLQTIE